MQITSLHWSISSHLPPMTSERQTPPVDSRLTEARACIGSGRLYDALDLLSALCEEHPNSSLAWTDYSTVLGKTGQYEQGAGAALRAISLDEENVDAITNLANCLAATGQFKDAQVYYQKALKLTPENPAVLTNLAVAYAYDGDTETAIRQLVSTTKKYPGFAPAHFQYGSILMELSEFKAAKCALEKASALTPDNASILNKLGLTLGSLGSFEQAGAMLTQAVQLHPENFAFLLDLGSLYLEMGNHIEALRLFRQAEALAPTSAAVCCAIGDAQARDARLDSALRYYNRALDLSPNFSNATDGKLSTLKRLQRWEDVGQLITQYRQRGPLSARMAADYLEVCQRDGQCEDALEQLDAVCSRTGTSTRDKVVAHFALGKYYDRSRNFEKAFSHFDLGNKLLDYQYDYHSDKRYIDSLLNYYSLRRYGRLNRSSHTTRKAVFIVGMPRSGTTLLESMLSMHTNIGGAGELSHFDTYSNYLKQVMNYPTDTILISQELIDQFSSDYLSYLDQTARGYPHTIDKMPANFRNIPLIKLVLPESTIIHIRRDPIDCGLSNYFQRFSAALSWSTSLQDIARYYGLYTRCMEHWINILNVDLIEIDYETLVTQPETALKTILAKLQLEWEPACLRFFQSERAIATASETQVKQPLYTESVSKWKNYADYVTALKPLTTGTSSNPNPQRDAD